MSAEAIVASLASQIEAMGTTPERAKAVAEAMAEICVAADHERKAREALSKVGFTTAEVHYLLANMCAQH